MENNGLYYTVNETAKILRCNRSTILSRIHDGDIPAFRIGIGKRRWLVPREWVHNLATTAQEEGHGV